MAINKMFILLPVMFAARKLDGEDPTTVYWLRIAYFSVQTIILALVGYTYIQASAAAKTMDGRVIYVPPPPQPFADPNAKKKYTETPYAAHVISQARSLLGSTVFGIIMTSALHYYRGMVMGLAMQAVMAPFNVTENAIFSAVVLGGGIKPEDKIFKELSADELTSEDEVVDASGNPVVRSITKSANTSSSKGTSGKNEKPFEDILLDTWDSGAEADLGPLLAAVNKKNCNFKTKESGWTPLMILAGLSVKGSSSGLKQVRELGGNPAIVDKDGWNAMHWAGFHGNVEAAKILADGGKLHLVKDKEGLTPLHHARTEGNEDVAKFLEGLEESANEKKADDGLRKRK